MPPDIREIHQNITLAIDIICVNNCSFLTTISSNLFYWTVHYLTRITGHELSTVLNEAFQSYQKAGYNIHTIKADNEFKRIFSSMNDMNINMQFCNPDDHVLEAVRNNCTIKERCRIMYYSLPVWRKHTIKSKNYSSSITYNIQNTWLIFIWTINTSLQRSKPMNTLIPRTLDCIYIKPASNWQNGHVLWHIATGGIITRSQIYLIPISDSVIMQFTLKLNKKK